MGNELNVVEMQEPATDMQASALSLIMDDERMARLVQFAEIMAGGKATVPKHLAGNVGDCMAVSLQAMQWGMNPFSVAQKTHVVNGTLGYEAQLVNAVVQSSKAISGRFHYEYQGQGEALQCRVGAVIRGENQITWGEWLAISQVTTRNSPLWKANPKQQMGYLQVKNWARAYCPGAILGVYSVDELEPAPAEPRDITPTATVLPRYPDDLLEQNLPGWSQRIAAGKANAQHIINMVSSKYTLSDEQVKKIKAAETPKAKTADPAPAPTPKDDWTDAYENAEGAHQ